MFIKAIQANGDPSVVVNTAGSCGKKGILLQNVGALKLEFAEDPGDIPASATDNATGWSLDVGEKIVLNPFVGVLWCHLSVKGANAGRLAIHVFDRE